jgi:transposase
MSYRRYARELKDQACALVIEEKYDPADAGRQLGIPEMTLRGWLAKRGWKGVRSMSMSSKSNNGDVRSMPESNDPKVLNARIRELEAKLRRAEMERDILKKATAYFAGPHLTDSPGSTSTGRSSK